MDNHLQINTPDNDRNDITVSSDIIEGEVIEINEKDFSLETKNNHIEELTKGIIKGVIECIIESIFKLNSHKKRNNRLNVLHSKRKCKRNRLSNRRNK